MNKIFHYIVIALLFFSVQAFAGDAVSVALKDGSVISGELLSLQNGVYTVSSDSLGTVSIDETKIRAIRYGSQGGGTDPIQSTGGQTQAIQQAMVSDEQIMSLILSMQNDPDVQKILSDPEIMNAVLSGDANTLKSNPKFIKLMNHPTIRKIQNKVVK
jgi:hypothetical protein